MERLEGRLLVWNSIMICFRRGGVVGPAEGVVFGAKVDIDEVKLRRKNRVHMMGLLCLDMGIRPGK